ncbi:MAG: hypothetical protein V2B20_28470 [Pseudomonadota bacterium]
MVTEKASTHFDRLGQVERDISEVSEVISEIFKLTDLLALNRTGDATRAR